MGAVNVAGYNLRQTRQDVPGMGDWQTQRDRRDQRELEREQTRLEKRHLRDLRWAVERSVIVESDWADLLALQQQHGKEGPLQLWRELIPYWSQCQALNGGAVCPPSLFPQDICKNLRANPQQGPTTRKAPGAPRKQRADRGKARKRG